MSSPPPEYLSPAIAVTLSPSLPPPEIIASFPSPLQPSPPTGTGNTTTTTTTPPLLPPALSPAADNSPPPVVSPPPPVTPLLPPPALPPSPPATALPPPANPGPLPSPVFTPPPELIPRPPPSKRTTPLPPSPSPTPPTPTPTPTSEPSTPSTATDPPSPAIRLSTPPPQPTPSTSPLPPLTLPSSSLSPASSSSPPGDTIPSPASNSAIKPLPRMASPSSPLPSSSSSPSPSSLSFPAAVEILKPRPNHVLAGLTAGSVVVGLVVVAAIVVAVVVFACVCYRSSSRRRKRSSHENLENYYKATTLDPKALLDSSKTLQSARPMMTNNSESTNHDHQLPKPPHSIISPNSALMIISSQNDVVLTYDMLAAATEGFSESKLIGEGGFGQVYKAMIPGGKEVAVKKLRRGSGSGQGEREFQAEVDTISRVHHKHLVSLLAYCITGPERLLVYEFVPNQTLEFHLHGKDQHVMAWETRLKIAIGSAKGLAYLHEDCNPKIIHRDIKASNILLDFRFEAKVSDFGLAKSFSDTSTHISTRVVGTFGYLAPEYVSSGKVTEKSDVYSYGVVLLELITGRPPITPTDPIRNQALVEWARPLLTHALEEGCLDTLADPRLQRQYDAGQMTRMVACAAACVRHSAWLRPRMSQIVHALEGHSSLRDLNEGMAPGNSSVYSSKSCNYNVHQYNKDLNKFHLTINTDQDSTSKNWYSGSTSDYGLNPSISSSEYQQTLTN